MRNLIASAASAAAFLLSAVAPAAFAQTPIPGVAGSALALNPSTHRLFVANDTMDRVQAVDGLGVVGYANTGHVPHWIAMNVPLNRVYLGADGDGTLTVVDGASLNVLATVAIGGAGPIAVDETTNKIYVVRRKLGDVVVVDGATYAWAPIVTGSMGAQSVAVDPQLARLYVTYATSGDVRVIATGSPPSAPVSIRYMIAGHPSLVAVNAGTHRAYVLSDDASAMMTVIDGNNGAVQTLASPGHGGATPTGLALNSGSNIVYAAFGADVVTLNGATNALAFITAPASVGSMAVDTVTNKIFAMAGARTLVAIDGATNATTNTSLSFDASAVAINPSDHTIYVAGNGLVMFGGSPSPQPSTLPQAVYQGLWWNSPANSEPGWGLNIAQQGDKVFATWFTYDEGGHAAWFVMPDSSRTGPEEFSGTLYRVLGPPYTGAFDSTRVSATAAGAMVLRFSDRDNGTMVAEVNGTRITKSITRQVFGNVPTCTEGGSFVWPINRTDLWWSAPAGGESGWGIFLTQQDLTIFATWFTYDTDGKPVWFVASNVTLTGNQTYSGSLYRTWGPGYAVSPWDGRQVTVMPVGSISLSFTDDSNGVFSYNLGGLTGSKAITRQSFSTPQTTCR